jgi:hypothetical protein
MEKGVSVLRHVRLGYVVQISSLLTLGLLNIVLPNWIGVTEFARLNEAYAFIGFSAILFNEGASLLVIRAINKIGRDPGEARDIALQAALEHILAIIPVLALVIAITNIVAPQHTYGLLDWALVGISGMIIAIYVVTISWLTALHMNHHVAVLAIVQGLLSFLLPVGAFVFGYDVRLSIAFSHILGLFIFARLALRKSKHRWRPTLALDKRVCLVPSLFALSAQTAMRLTVMWLPVLVLIAGNYLADSGSYKIALSLAMGVVAIVPYHKQTVLSLSHGDKLLIDQLAAGALFTSAVGAQFLIILAEPVTKVLYSSDYSGIAGMLPVFSLVIVLQVLADVMLVQLSRSYADKVLLRSSAIAVAIAAIALVFVNYVWLPALTLASFIVCVIYSLRSDREYNMTMRAARLAVTAALIGILLPYPFNTIISFATLVFGILVDARLRGALHLVLARILGRHTA